MLCTIVLHSHLTTSPEASTKIFHRTRLHFTSFCHQPKMLNRVPATARSPNGNYGTYLDPSSALRVRSFDKSQGARTGNGTPHQDSDNVTSS